MNLRLVCLLSFWLCSAQGFAEDARIGGINYPIRWVLKETFSTPDWAERWRVETESAHVEAGALGLVVRNSSSAATGGTSVWLRERLPTDIFVRIKAQTLLPAAGNACNLNVILNASEPDGAALSAQRSGAYKELHTIPNLIVTFTGGNMPGWTRVRRDPGFQLVSECDRRTDSGREYELVYILSGGRLQVWINGERVHDWIDPAPLSGGAFALRTWRSNVAFRSVEIGQILNR